MFSRISHSFAYRNVLFFLFDHSDPSDRFHIHDYCSLLTRSAERFLRGHVRIISYQYHLYQHGKWSTRLLPASPSHYLLLKAAQEAHTHNQAPTRSSWPHACRKGFHHTLGSRSLKKVSKCIVRRLLTSVSCHRSPVNTSRQYSTCEDIIKPRSPPRCIDVGFAVNWRAYSASRGEYGCAPRPVRATPC
ncbi:hypothetical protein BD779DRAFT_685454 [Infundibulicybe gibba]|nr:hypothetical protein BD779DRAFT_685454 [Infundibulicybe gibba]